MRLYHIADLNKARQIAISGQIIPGSQIGVSNFPYTNDLSVEDFVGVQIKPAKNLSNLPLYSGPKVRIMNGVYLTANPLNVIDHLYGHQDLGEYIVVFEVEVDENNLVADPYALNVSTEYILKARNNPEFSDKLLQKSLKSSKAFAVHIGNIPSGQITSVQVYPVTEAYGKRLVKKITLDKFIENIENNEYESESNPVLSVYDLITSLYYLNEIQSDWNLNSLQITFIFLPSDQLQKIKYPTIEFSDSELKRTISYFYNHTGVFNTPVEEQFSGYPYEIRFAFINRISNRIKNARTSLNIVDYNIQQSQAKITVQFTKPISIEK